MYKIGIDVGSTYTKYCGMNDTEIVDLFMERTPVRQSVYFTNKIQYLKERYPCSTITTCGYGKENISSVDRINELVALARGSYEYIGNGLILDIGGQDTKIVEQKNGKLLKFFLNDKCAAGSGIFLSNTLNLLGVDFGCLNLSNRNTTDIRLSSNCAVFAQSEIVELIARNIGETDIVLAVVEHIMVKAKALLAKVNSGKVVLSGGLSQIVGIQQIAERVLGVPCCCVKEGAYLAAIGCALYGI